MGLCLLLQTPTHAARTFFWTFETDQPDQFPVGTDSTPTYSDSTVRETFPFAYSGSYCLEVANGTYNSATFDNPTANHIWASPDEGTIRVKFRFTGTANYMLFQIIGKDRTMVDDTNDGIQFRYNGSNKWRIRYFWTGTGTSNTGVTAPAAPDTWHTAQIKWRASQAPHFSASIDSTEALSNTTFGAVDCAAWHHLLIGNDLSTDPEGLWFDDFEVFDEWLNDVPTSVMNAAAGQGTAPAVHVGPQPMHKSAAFRFDRPVSGSIAIYSSAGRPIRGISMSGTSPTVQWDGRDAYGIVVPPGLYVYHAQTAGNAVTGTLLKTGQ
jgi:hypothetical protein